MQFDYKQKPLYLDVKLAIANREIIPIKQRYTGIGIGLNAMLHYNSSQRAAMFGGHLSQTLVVKGAKPRRLNTGIEFEYGKYTWAAELPVKARIVDFIPRFERTGGRNGIMSNSVHYVLYENQEDDFKGELAILEVPEHHIMHQQYGFRYRPTDVYRNLQKNQLLPKYTRLMESPNIDPVTEEWSYGLDCNVCFGSFYQCIEDGAVARRGILNEFIATGIENRVASFGKQRFPINLCGDDDNYQIIPDIGQQIGDDGLLIALREVDPVLSIVDMMTENLQTPDYVYDDLIYAEPGATISNIDVVSDRMRRGAKSTRIKNPMLEEKLRPAYAQLMKYEKAIGVLYERIERAVSKHERERTSTTQIQHQTVLKYLNLGYAEHGIDGVGSNGARKRIFPTRDYRKENLDDWRLTVTFTYDVVPGIGYKFTDCHGGKFVVTDVMEDNEMPVDEWGNVADFMFSDDTVVKRMNLGRVNEPHINATGDQILRDLAPDIEAGNLEKVWNTLMRYYYIVSPEFVEQMIEPVIKTDEQRWNHIRWVQKHRTSITCPTDSIAAGSARMEHLIDEFPLRTGKVKWRGRSGNWRTSKNNIMIGQMYIMMLEKTANDWSAIGIPKLQAHGLPTKLSNSDKYGSPGKEQATRYAGESEIREIYSFAGGWFTSVFMEYANNPKLLDYMDKQIYATDKPSALHSTIDFDQFPLGGNRALRIFNHHLACAGCRVVDADDIRKNYDFSY